VTSSDPVSSSAVVIARRQAWQSIRGAIHSGWLPGQAVTPASRALATISARAACMSSSVPKAFV